MKYLKIAKTTVYCLVCLFLVIVASVIVFSFFDTPWGYRLFVVQSGSMEPTIRTGSVVFVYKAENYQTGDVVSFVIDPKLGVKDSKNVVTHRVASVEKDEKGQKFITKGDANKSPDQEKATSERILGKVVLTIPYVGHLVSFAKTQLGLIVLVIIPGTIIIYNELMTIKNEALRLIRKRRTKKLTPLEEVEEKVGETIIKVEKKWSKK